MTKTMHKALLAIGAGSLMALSGVSSAQDDPVKVGFVYVSPIGDAGWTWQQDIGRKEMEEALDGKVVSQYVENVPEGADAERVIRDLAEQGNELIFTTSFGYMNPTIKVARQFPDVKFVHSTGYKTAPNVATTNSRFYEARYLGGIVAGKMTESNVIGYVGAFPIPEVLQGINGFTRGLRSVNPDAEVRVIWANTWYDPGKERDAALALLSQGADVVTHHTDSTAVVQAAQDEGKYVVAYHSDMQKYGPDAQIAAVTHHWGDYFTEQAKAVVDGDWETSSTWGGLKSGMAALDGIGDMVPDDVRELVEEKKEQIASGELAVFDGPIVDNEGKTQHESGVLDDDGLNNMNYYVRGVASKYPDQ